MATILIIGASRGLGLEFVRQYAGRGWRVLATVRDLQHGRAVSEAGAEVFLCDVGDPAAIGRLATALAGERLDVVLHNAGIYGANQPFGGIEPADLAEVLRINTIAPVLTAQALAGHLRDGAVFAVISSMMGSIADNASGGSLAYRVSKAGLNQAIRTLAHAVAGQGGIAVALSPGWVRTEMGGPEAPLSPPEAVAGLIAVLDGLTPADSGTFRHYDGRLLPW